MKPIISVEGLGKKYTIRHDGQGRYRALREEIFKLPMRLFQRKRQEREEFWALKDVSFDIMPGDRVGIIGRNGAGKSTLLKLLSRITEPSTGKISLRGRVASLLEVGTGFHPELTGRENIFLNGAILGMSRAEVHRKFDEIVDFAGVEKFLDTPVKRYSSGMYVRLAFAVAAHLEPEILIVDEVLAVGDAEFQKKCLGKMEEVGQEGRTVLFVSHNMAAMRQLCNNGILLQNGEIINYSKIDNIISQYNINSKQENQIRYYNKNDDIIEIEDIIFKQEGNTIFNTFDGRYPLIITLKYKIKKIEKNLRIFLDIKDDFDNILLRIFEDASYIERDFMPPGNYVSKIILSDIFGPQNYLFQFSAGIHNKKNISLGNTQFKFSAVHSGTWNGKYMNDVFRAKLTSPFKWNTEEIK